MKVNILNEWARKSKMCTVVTLCDKKYITVSFRPGHLRIRLCCVAIAVTRVKP